MILHALKLLVAPGEVTELRALEAAGHGYRTTTVSGYFNDVEALANAACDIEATGVYFTLNPVDPALLARSSNRVVAAPRHTTSDTDIHRRRWMLVDCDAVRPSGISSTDAEHEAALARAKTAAAYLTDQGWPAPVVADSGNGCHLLYCIDLPAGDGGLVERVLKSLAAKFDDAEVKVDTSVHNAARICRLYGTVARKGDSTADRPHRVSRIISAPTDPTVVTEELMLGIAGEAPAVTPGTGSSAQSGFDLDVFIRSHNLSNKPPRPWQGSGRRWVLDVCPWNPDHNNGEAYIAQLPNGAISAGCHHNSCRHHRWHDLRDKCEPGWRTRTGASGRDQERLWPDPQPVAPELLTVEPFDPGMLPDTVRDHVLDVAERMQCPVEFVAVGLMVSLATALGNKAGMRPKQHDHWTVTPNLWGAIVAGPAQMKTPALGEATQALRLLQRELDSVHREEVARHAVDEDIRAVAMKKLKKAFEQSKVCEDEYRRRVEELAGGSEPALRRLIVNDTSVEKLGELLAENPHGLCQYRDELNGLLATFDKPGHESDRAFLLETWNGDGSYTFDRIGRGTVHIERATLSLLGGIQPGPLLSHFRDAETDGAKNDGLVQRLQLLVWPDPSRGFRLVDRLPNEDARDRADEVVRRLFQLDPKSSGAEVAGDGRFFFRFDHRAQEIFNNWYVRLQTRTRNSDEHPMLVAHQSKLPKTLASLALITHLAEGGKRPVTADALNKALRWVCFLESHARRLYGAIAGSGDRAAATLAKRLADGALFDGFGVRDVVRHGWSGLKHEADVRDALTTLDDAGWVISTVERTGGAPRTLYWINPKVRQMKNAQAQAMKKADEAFDGAATTPGERLSEPGEETTPPEETSDARNALAEAGMPL